MSFSESFPFVARVTGATADARVTLLDGHDNVVVQDMGAVATSVPPGLYTVRVEHAGQFSEEIVRHTEPTQLDVAAPQRWSSVPASDTASTHEYYRGPAENFSRMPTAEALTGAPSVGGSGLFVFVRRPAAHTTQPLPDDCGLRVLGYDGNELARLDSASTQTDPGAGWIAFHAAAEPGDYVLAYDGSATSVAREMALSVFAGWQTQVFLTWVDGPSFPSASVLLGHSGFDADDRLTQVVDAAIAALQSNAFEFPSTEITSLLHAKFDNPMMGLIGAHAVLRSPNRTKDDLVPIVENLIGLLGHTPDVRALELMAGLETSAEPFDRPPLLRPGLEAVLAAAAADQTGLVPPGSLLARIGPRRLTDSAWSMWDPVVGDAGADAEPPEWLAEYVDNAQTTASARGEKFDPTIAAAKVSLPAATIATTYDALRAAMPPGDARTAKLENAVAKIRKQAPQDWSKRTAADAKRLFFQGDEGERIEAIAVMQGHERLRDFDIAMSGITNSRSAFEQYHALKLAHLMLPGLDERSRDELRRAIETQRGAAGWIEQGGDRWNLTNRILTDLQV